MPHALPRVVEFPRDYDVRVKTDELGTIVTAFPLASTRSPRYARAADLPYSARTADHRVDWFNPPPAASRAEAIARGHYYFEAFVSYVRGTQRDRRKKAEDHVQLLLDALYAHDECRTEAWVFAEHIAQALVAHLRYGLDDGQNGQSDATTAPASRATATKATTGKAGKRGEVAKIATARRGAARKAVAA